MAWNTQMPRSETGQSSKDLLCLPPEDVEVSVDKGKPAGPQLVWLPDGRLEVTMFRMQMKPGGDEKSAPPLVGGWQKLVDPRTGAVEDVPADQVPASPSTATPPSVSPDGRKVGWSFTDASGTRTLLSVSGPGEYTYGFGPMFWAPGYQWIAGSDDNRILVITTGDPSLTRVLVTGALDGAGGGTAGPVFAVTDQDLLSPAG